jgi:twitching motility protein PilT
MGMAASRRLGEILVDRRAISRDQLEELLNRELEEQQPLWNQLLAGGLVAEKDLVAAVAEQVGKPFIDFEVTPLNPVYEKTIPAELAQKHHAVAVGPDGDSLIVAMADPNDRAAVKELSEATSERIQPAFALREELDRILSTTGSDPVNEDRRRLMEDEPVAVHVNELLARVVELGGSDLHITAGIHPSVRINGDIKPLTEYPVLTGSEIRRMVYAILTQKQRERFEEDLELDTSHSIPNVGRFRVNVFVQRNSVGAVMRVIPYEIKFLDDLGLPPILHQLARLPRGLVLVTGPTGSGKSTTLASMVDVINSENPVHIMTVEDPIEFLHDHKTAVVNQREVGEDTHGFAESLKHVLRQDPDVILVGEMRDLETISTALTAAETGHLVFATLHTQDAPQSVDRIIDVFPSFQQQQVRVQLASSLQGVVTQTLVPSIDGNSRVVAVEVLTCTPAVRNLIRDGKTHQIPSAMQAGAKFGMVTMDMSLAALVKNKQISLEAAIEACHNEEDLRRLINSPGIS